MSNPFTQWLNTAWPGTGASPWVNLLGASTSKQCQGSSPLNHGLHSTTLLGFQLGEGENRKRVGSICRVLWERLKVAYIYMCLLTQLCWTLCNPMDCFHQAPLFMRIFQARLLEWGACPFSRGSSQPRDQIQVSCIAGGLFTTWATRQ